MSTIDANELVLMESREIEEAQTRKAKTKPSTTSGHRTS